MPERGQRQRRSTPVDVQAWDGLKLGARTGRWTGYDPTLEDVEALRAASIDWTPVCMGDDTRPKEYHPDWLKTENQGGTPSCCGHALSSCMECVYHFASGGKILQFSRWFAWLEEQRMDGGRLSPNRGASIQAAAKVAKNLGLPEEQLCPFRGESWDPSVTAEAYENAKKYRAKTTFWIESYEQALDFLKALAGAIVIGIPWGRGGWHAVIYGGYWENGDLELVNSHGANYGTNGRRRDTPRTVANYLKTRNVVFCGISDMLTPQVRKFDWRTKGLV